MDPLAGRPAANSTPPTRICSALFPGAFQFNVVLPTLAPAASVMGFGFAVNVTDRSDNPICLYYLGCMDHSDTESLS